MKTILVTGGAGFIGTNVVNELASNNYKVVVIDNFSNSYKRPINRVNKKHNNIVVYNADLCNVDQLNSIFANHKFDCVIHLAGKKYIKESFIKQNEYKLNNIDATINLLNAMTKFGVKKIVFSSSITVYGVVDDGSISETNKLAPISPYAEHKMIGEQLIKDWAKNNNNYVILRLSNPMGANTKLMLGDNGKSKFVGLLTDLFNSVKNDRKITINGNFHPTPDGTTVRDYVHVCDVASAFRLAIEYNKNDVFNIGMGEPGASVLQVLKQVENVTNKKINYSFGPMRSGDASIYITNNNKSKMNLGFDPKHTLNDMVLSYYNFVKYKNGDKKQF